MIRFDTSLAPRSFRAAAAAVLAGVVALSCAAADDRERELVEQIQEILSREGPYSVGLLEPLKGLALLYDESGDHRFALVALEQAQQVTRANYGLHSLEQVPLVEQRIRHEEERGNHAESWKLQQDLLTLIRRHPGDLRTAPMLRDVADRQMATLRAYIDGEKRPEVIYGCFYKQWQHTDASCNAGSRKTVVQGMLAEAQRNYAAAITVMLGHGLYGNEELRELEMELLEGVELVRTMYEGPGGYSMAMVPSAWGAEYLEPWRGRMAPLIELADWGADQGTTLNATTIRQFGEKHSGLVRTYSRGRQSLRRLYAYETASASPPLAQGEALARIADWDLLYSHNGLALDGYEVAHMFLLEAALPPDAVKQVFAPATPIVLPAFKDNPLSSDETRPATGHVDVGFSLTKYGRARGIEIRDAVNASEDAQKELVAVVNRSRFRPQLIDGRFADETPVVFRYYLRD